MTLKNSTQMQKIPNMDYHTIEKIHERFDDFFNSFFSSTPYALTAMALPTPFPSITMYESPLAVTIKAELPAISENDVSITVEKNRLIISGEKKSEDHEEKPTYYVNEISYGKFSRSITLHFDIDPSKTKATFSKGMLTIVIEKPETAKQLTKATIPVTHE